MRRLMPMWSSLVAVLLLLQWVGAMAACIPHLAAPTVILCHVDDARSTDQAPAPHAGAACPLCAPLPPVILASPPAPFPPRTAMIYPTACPVPALAVPSPARTTPQQPRAPPTLS